jgi:acetate kinase
VRGTLRRGRWARPDPTEPVIAALNVGSSSLKFALFRCLGADPYLERLTSGSFVQIGARRSSFTVRDGTGSIVAQENLSLGSGSSPTRELSRWMDAHQYGARLAAVGHRIVHGGRWFASPQPVTLPLFRRLRALSAFDPEHLPAELEGIRLVRDRYPHLLQVACFDTAFHRTMPRLAQLYAIPRRWTANGILRYGFHGLSCEYVVEHLAAALGNQRVPDRLVVAHLGNGCSMTAIRNGRSIDTTMGFTPTGGMVMSTRSGDLDPEVVVYMAQHSQRTTAQLSRVLNRESGLLGISGSSGDMRVLLRRARRDLQSREAVDLFCYQAGKSLGALASVLGGIDTLVFTGGIGENAPEIRRRIGLAASYLGVRIDPQRNARNLPIISTQASRVTVRVIPADEERIIAGHTFRIWARKTRRGTLG